MINLIGLIGMFAQKMALKVSYLIFLMMLSLMLMLVLVLMEMLIYKMALKGRSSMVIFENKVTTF